MGRIVCWFRKCSTTTGTTTTTTWNSWNSKSTYNSRSFVNEPAPTEETPVWHPGAPAPSTVDTTTVSAAAVDSYAVQELVGMGFDEKTAIDALNKQNGDLEAATNYLLDNA